MSLGKLINPMHWFAVYRRSAVVTKLRSCGENFSFDPLSSILTPHLMDVGNNVFIGERAHIAAEVTIGNNVMFGPRPIILGGDHYFAVKGKSVRFMRPRERENNLPIVIEDEAWLGARVILLKGVRIGMGSVVGAAAVVTRSIPPYTVAAGNPARPVRAIFDDVSLAEHIVLLGYDASIAETTVVRRRRELVDWKIESLPAIDRTDSYWETAPGQ